MTKSREIAILRQLENLAVCPARLSSRAVLVAFVVMIGGGVFLSAADNLLPSRYMEALKWCYFGCGMVAGLSAYFLASTSQRKYVSQYVDLEAVRKRLADLSEAGGANA